VNLRPGALVSVAVSVALVAAVAAGCGYDGPAGGVAAVSAQPSPAEDQSGDLLVVTVPDATGDDDVAQGPTDSAEASIEPAEPAPTLVAPPTPLPRTVAVVGDSLTLSARDEIDAALTGRGLSVLAIDGLESRRLAHGGRELPPGVDAIEEILTGPEPGLWVIALGTNDVASDESLTNFRADLQSVLALIPDAAPIVWVDLWIRGREGAIAEANRMIRTELRRWSGGAAVVDWYGHGTDEGIIGGDGVHLTEAGKDLFAASIVDAIDGLYPR
jgi:lysophospholipase L1-like esterase